MFVRQSNLRISLEVDIWSYLMPLDNFFKSNKSPQSHAMLLQCGHIMEAIND